MFAHRLRLEGQDWVADLVLTSRTSGEPEQSFSLEDLKDMAEIDEGKSSVKMT